MLDNLKIPEKLPDCLEKPTEALATPIATESGNGIGAIFSCIFSAPVFWSEKLKIKRKYQLEAYEREIKKKYSEIPEDKRVEPNFSFVASALEASKYSLEEETIRNLYTNLIANSMNSDYVESIHPSYIEIIKQLSPRDASNLAIFQKNLFSGQDVICFPIANYVQKIEKSRTLLRQNVFLENELYKNEKDVMNQSISITNLERLKLIEIDFNAVLPDKNLYSSSYNELEDTYYGKFYKTEFFKGFCYGNTKNFNIDKGITRLTAYGRSFLKVCFE